MKVTIDADYYGNRDKKCRYPLYKKSEVDLLPGVTVLVGCNGSGKTTFLMQLKDFCKYENIPILSYNNRENDGGRDLGKAVLDGKYDLAGELFISSEGEKINTNFSNHVSEIGKFFAENRHQNDIVITADAVDSGLSIDHMISIKEDLFPLIIKDNSYRNVYIVIATNAYEFARQENCLDVTNLEYIKFVDYEDYRNFIIESRKYKNKRYHWEPYKVEISQTISSA